MSFRPSLPYTVYEPGLELLTQLMSEQGQCSLVYSPPQRLEGNKSLMFVDGSACVAAVAHRNFYSEVEDSNLCQIAFVLIDIAFVSVSMSL